MVAMIIKKTKGHLMSHNFSRRNFLKASMYGLGAATIAMSLTGCNSDDDNKLAENDFAINFNHGVASGDPLSDAIILWTRVTPSGAPQGVNLTLQIADDENFDINRVQQSVVALTSNDYTVKIDFAGLNAGSKYYYRFVTENEVSPTGQFKTLPQGSVDSVKFAVMSCANYPAGYFHAYAEAAKLTDIDAVLHLGDYIYEYGMGGYATENAQALGRELADDNAGEIITLEDYRKRYALYRSDTSLQQLHANSPFIAVWDDHEVANDSFKNGAENHNDGEGDFTARKLAALQAYFEWMPIRPYVKGQTESLYRQFEYGDLVSLYMLDTRHESRAKPLDYANYIDPVTGQIDSNRFILDLIEPTQKLIGTDQLIWLQDGMINSNATWQVLGQQVLMNRMHIPAELLAELANPSAQTAQTLTELAQIKGRLLAGDPTLTEMEKARVTTLAPYNLDAWDGYPVERELILQTANEFNKNLIALAGDTHNAWGGQLKDGKGNVCGYEFATSSVTSPGLEYYLQLPEQMALQFAEALKLLVDDLEYANIHQRGFMTVTFTAEKAHSEWHLLSSVHQSDYQMSSQMTEVLAK